MRVTPPMLSILPTPYTNASVTVDEPWLLERSRNRAQEPDHRHRWLLRARRERPRRPHGAQKDHELMPSDVGHGPLPPRSHHQQPTDPSSRSTARSASRRVASKSLGQI